MNTKRDSANDTLVSHERRDPHNGGELKRDEPLAVSEELGSTEKQHSPLVELLFPRLSVSLAKLLFVAAANEPAAETTKSRKSELITLQRCQTRSGTRGGVQKPQKLAHLLHHEAFQLRHASSIVATRTAHLR